MLNYHITHRRPNQEAVVYMVRIPEFGETGFYQQVTSLNWFKGREVKRAYLDTKSVDWAKHAQSIEYCSVQFADDQPDVKPVQTFTSLWDFYRHIRYDYKRKRYLTETGQL
jgi:hypothetical protein